MPKKTTDTESKPFGAGAIDVPATVESPAGAERSSRKRPRRKRARRSGDGPAERTSDADAGARDAGTETGAKTDATKGAVGRGGVDRDGAAQAEGKPRDERGAQDDGQPRTERKESGRSARRRRWQERRRKKRKKPGGGGPRPQEERAAGPEAQAQDVTGMLYIEKANHGHVRLRERDYLSAKSDVHVAPQLVQRFGLRDGSIVNGRVRRGHGRHKWELASVVSVDDKDPAEVRGLTAFKQLTSIDPDFHYALGDATGEVSLKVIDLLCPVGRGQRGLIVSPPRAGKTTLLQQFARGIEQVYPEVHLIVLLVDERPEEATEWRRTIERGEVFVSTNDEMAKKHVDLAEVVWRRCRRLVELGEDVVLLLDSITRLGRAYNNVKGNTGRTMSGGLDTRALERPKQFFGAARNTETAGSLTILGTTLIETGSRMDQVIFEEFKGTGNMELVLSRRLADRRIFPAIDIEKTGTRKEEKLHSARRLKRVNTLRRVLTRMHWAEAMELLIAKLEDVDKIDDFLERFEVDPEA